MQSIEGIDDFFPLFFFRENSIKEKMFLDHEIYFVAIIDVLTQYGVRKQVCFIIFSTHTHTLIHT